MKFFYLLLISKVFFSFKEIKLICNHILCFPLKIYFLFNISFVNLDILVNIFQNFVGVIQKLIHDQKICFILKNYYLMINVCSSNQIFL